MKQISTWPKRGISAFQDCFECTDWTIFREAATINQHINLGEHAESMNVVKNIATCANQKPWFTREVRMLLKAHNAAFYSGDKDTLRLPTTILNWGVRAANRADGQKIQSYFSNTKKPRRLWQCIKSITDYKFSQTF